MADIFISYSSEDKTRVKIVAEALERKGWSVWWDRQIPVGQRFDTVIEQELSESKCVVVIWTQRSANSEWVKNEASDAAQRNILVPLLLEDVKIPLAFRRIEAARLIGWSGEPDHPELTILFNAVDSIINGKPVDQATTNDEHLHETTTQYIEKKKRKYLLLTGVCLLIAALLLYFYFRWLYVSTVRQNHLLIFFTTVILFGISTGMAAFAAIRYRLITTNKITNTGLQLIPPGLALVLVVSGLLFLPRKSGPRLVRIEGQVKTAAEIPIKDVEVNADGTRFYATTITNGTYRLILENYSIGDEVTLTTSTKDFEDKSIAVKISSRDMKVDFVLNPVSRTRNGDH